MKYPFLPASWSPECWGLRYFWDRLMAAQWRFFHPGAPWLTREAVRLLESRLKGDERVLEFGAGRSTLWFARRCARVISIEQDPRWADLVKSRVKQAGLGGKLDLRECCADTVELAAEDVLPGSMDVVLIDGVRRAECLRAALPKLRPGGLLILDNINRSIPCDSPGPGSLRAWDSNQADHRLWKTLSEEMANWENTRTCDGVTDTWVLRKPGCGLLHPFFQGIREA